jgi:hypothetical protein
MSHTTITLPGPPAGWLTILFAAMAAVAVWAGLAHPTRAVAYQPAPMPAAVTAPAADPSAVFVGVAPKAADVPEEPAPTF